MTYAHCYALALFVLVNSCLKSSLNNLLLSVSRSDQFSAMMPSTKSSTLHTGKNLFLNIAMNMSMGLNVSVNITLAIMLNGKLHTTKILSRFVKTVTVEVMTAIKTYPAVMYLNALCLLSFGIFRPMFSSSYQSRDVNCPPSKSFNSEFLEIFFPFVLK